MLRADRWQAPHAHAVVRVHGRSEIAAAIYGDFVSQARQFAASLLVIRFDSAVFGDHAATANKGDTDAAAWAGLGRGGGEGLTFPGRLEPGGEVEQLLHLLIWVVVWPDATAGCGSHLFDEVGTGT